MVWRCHSSCKALRFWSMIGALVVLYEVGGHLPDFVISFILFLLHGSSRSTSIYMTSLYGDAAL